MLILWPSATSSHTTMASGTFGVGKRLRGCPIHDRPGARSPTQEEMMRILTMVCGVVMVGMVAGSVAMAQEVVTAPAEIRDVGVNYSPREALQSGWVRYTLGVLPTAEVIQTDAKTRLCAHISADYLSASTTFEVPDGVDFPLTVNILQSGVSAPDLCEDIKVGSIEITCP